jgi:hypothetical protein
MDITQPKWVIWSTTMIGTAMVTITGVLPAVNAMLMMWLGPDYSFEPGWVAAIGEGLKATIAGLGSLVGVVMIIKARWFKVVSQPLTLLPPSWTGKA